MHHRPGERSEADHVLPFLSCTGWEPEGTGGSMARFGLLAVAAKATVLVFAVPHSSALKGEASVSAFSRCQLVFVSAAPLPNLQKIL